MEVQPTAPRGHKRTDGLGANPWLPVLALLATALMASTANDKVADVLGPLGVMVGQAIAGWLIWRNAGSFTGRERLSWRLVGSGFLLTSVGVLVVAIIGFLNGSAPAFGPTDLIFVLSYILILFGFASLPHIASSTAQRFRIFLDGLIGAVSLAAVLWAMFLAQILARLEGAPFWERLVASVYPVLDVVMLVMLLWVAVRRSTYRFDLRLFAFGAALAVQAAADLTFFVNGVGQTFEEASPAYGIYIVASAGYATAGVLLRNSPEPREYAERGPPLWAVVAPYSAMNALIILVAYTQIAQPGRPANRGLLAIAGVVVALVILRQSVEIRENRRYVEREREALIASISHELRTPLTAVIGVLELVMEEDALSREERIEMISMARGQAVYMGRIVEDLILLARDDSEHLDLSKTNQEIDILVSDAIESVSLATDHIEVEMPTGLVAVVDAERFKQVIVNLVSNAIKYGGPQIKLIGEIVGTDISIEIHDDGAGVPKRFELMVWEGFERGPNRLNSIIQGSGVGLTVIRTIVEAHGGHSSYRQSEVLGGACFQLILPIGGDSHADDTQSDGPSEETDPGETGATNQMPGAA